MTQAILRGGPLSGTLVEDVDKETAGLVAEIGERTYVYKRAVGYELIDPETMEAPDLKSRSFRSIPVFDIDWQETQSPAQWEMMLGM